MDYLRMHCHRCGGKFELYNHSMQHEYKPPRCPHCQAQMTQKQWNDLVNAYLTFHDVNKNFIGSYEDRGTALFQAELKVHYVPRENVYVEE